MRQRSLLHCIDAQRSRCLTLADVDSASRAGYLHGYAYGESIIGAEETPLIAYLLGFSLMQYALVLSVGLVLTRIRSLGHLLLADRAERLTGGVAVLTGILLLTWNVV